jgi:hypothetical protein
MTIDVSRSVLSVEPARAPRGAGHHPAPASADLPVVVPDEAGVVASLRPRLADVVPEQDVERVVHDALVALGPVRVTTYLPILVERRVRQALRATA